MFKVPHDQIVERAKAAVEHVKALEKELGKLREKHTQSANKGLVDEVREVKGVKLLSAVAKVENANDLRRQAARLLDRIGSGVVVLGAETGGKATLCVLVSKDLTDRFKAGKIIGPLAKIVGGGGGGKADMAQAGGPDASRLEEAIKAAEGIL